jgi:hypothetical protein
LKTDVATKTITLADDTIDILFAVDICGVARIIAVPQRKIKSRHGELPYTWYQYFAKIGDFPMEAVSQDKWSPNIPSWSGVYKAKADYYHESATQTQPPTMGYNFVLRDIERIVEA